MLTEELNRAFTEVGRGTLMGELLRRYWMPIAAVAELDDTPVKPVRLLGGGIEIHRLEGQNLAAAEREERPGETGGAFARRLEGRLVVVMAPRLYLKLVGVGSAAEDGRPRPPLGAPAASR